MLLLAGTMIIAIIINNYRNHSARTRSKVGRLCFRLALRMQIRHALRLNGGVQKNAGRTQKITHVFRPVLTRMMYVTSVFKELILSPYRLPGSRKIQIGSGKSEFSGKQLGETGCSSIESSSSR